MNSILAPVSGYQSTSLFSVIDPQGKTIAENQPYFLAFSVAKASPNARIKFSRMMGKVGGFALYISAKDRTEERQQLEFLKQAAQWLIRDIESELERLEALNQMEGGQ